MDLPPADLISASSASTTRVDRRPLPSSQLDQYPVGGERDAPIVREAGGELIELVIGAIPLVVEQAHLPHASRLCQVRLRSRRPSPNSVSTISVGNSCPS